MNRMLLVAVFAVLVVVQTIPTTEAFIIKTISIEKGPLPSLPSPEAAIGAITASKNALVQTITNAVTEKINTFKSLVGNVVQLKLKAKQDLLRTVTSASGNVVNSVSGILAAKPTIFTKTITFGFKKPVLTTTIVPVTVAATTTAGAPPATTLASGYSRYRRLTRTSRF